MKLTVGPHIFNTDNCVRHRGCTRVTVDQVTPRVYVRKEETLCHQKQNNQVFFNWVTATKYIDDNPVKTYSWIQDLEPDELEEFLKMEQDKKKKELDPEEQERIRQLKNQKSREYYHKHREEMLQRVKDYQSKNRLQQNAYSRQYYQEHKDTWNDKYVKPKKDK